jgi:zinc finger HIT domain-containing protein 1
MPLIEVLANTTSATAPGWAYVPDTGYDPSKAPLQPAARKRNARALGPAAEGTTAKQNAALLRRLADLDRDNFKDVQIAVPSKQKEGSAKGEQPAVRREEKRYPS